MHRALSLFLFFLSALFQRATLASDHFPQITAPSPRSSPQGATVQRALRQLLHALQVPSTGGFDYTSLLCPHHTFLCLALCPNPVPLPRGLLSRRLFCSNFMPCRCHRLAALMTHSFFVHTTYACLALSRPLIPCTPWYEQFYCETCSRPILSPSFFR